MLSPREQLTLDLENGEDGVCSRQLDTDKKLFNVRAMPLPPLNSTKKFCFLAAAALAPLASASAASNINDAFVVMETPDGHESPVFSGPLSGTISLGYSLDPSVAADFLNTGLAHTDNFPTSSGVQGYFYPNGPSVPALLIRAGENSTSPTFLSEAPLQIGQILLHPGNPSGDGFATPASDAVLRYTTTAPGVYEITGDFQSLGGASDETVSVRLNGVALASGTDAMTFDVTTPLLATDVLDFTVGSGPTFGSDSTGFRANIVSVIPEPASFGLLAFGGFAMLARRRGSRS